MLEGCATREKLSVAELVQCHLTLFYDYWQMNEVVAPLLESIVFWLCNSSVLASPDHSGHCYCITFP